MSKMPKFVNQMSFKGYKQKIRWILRRKKYGLVEA